MSKLVRVQLEISKEKIIKLTGSKDVMSKIVAWPAQLCSKAIKQTAQPKLTSNR